MHIEQPGPTTFLELADTPNSYSGAGGKVVSVKATVDGLEFTTGGGSGSNIATEKLTGTQSGTSVTLNLLSLSHTYTSVEWVSRQGQILTPTTGVPSGWTQSGDIVTVTNADASEDFLVNYKYS